MQQEAETTAMLQERLVPDDKLNQPVEATACCAAAKAIAMAAIVDKPDTHASLAPCLKFWAASLPIFIRTTVQPSTLSVTFDFTLRVTFR